MYYWDYRQQGPMRALENYVTDAERAERAQKINRLTAVRLAERQEILLLHGTRRDRRLGGKRRLRHFIKRAVTREVYGLKKPPAPKAQAFVEIGRASNSAVGKKPRKRPAAKSATRTRAR